MNAADDILFIEQHLASAKLELENIRKNFLAYGGTELTQQPFLAVNIRSHARTLKQELGFAFEMSKNLLEFP